ncbi:ThiF family adenylyltransferase [Panacagrimonas sp.]|uniref:ThiF family adenylyltransferase n=1 Tax=Panacagrimonas sp. TaxID=2480088 RepID=UPI003B5217FC
MDTLLDVTLLDPHWTSLQALAARSGNIESSAYLLFGSASIQADPWTGSPRLRLISHRYEPIADEDKRTASPMHVTWSTRGFMRLLSSAVGGNLIPGLVHTHPGSTAFFSEQDDQNEAELARTAIIKGARGLISIVMGGDGSVCARLWEANGNRTEATVVRTVGSRCHYWPSNVPGPADTAHLERQGRLFGTTFNPLLRALRVAVVGGGGTGSPLALLLARLGVGHLLLVDTDKVDTTTLNRMLGSRRADAVAEAYKVDVLEREIHAMDLGTQVRTRREWVNAPSMRDALRACDFVFGCTDDHAGRIFMNRFAHFYGVPVLDVGLRMMASQEGRGHDINGRVTALLPGNGCLLCAGVVDPRRAAAETLARTDPDEYQRRKAEAYVIGSGDPAPSVVTFTTEMACVAANEMIAALTGFHGHAGMVPSRVRRFHARDDRELEIRRKDYCPICATARYWGRGDINPFLDLIGEA